MAKKKSFSAAAPVKKTAVPRAKAAAPAKALSSYVVGGGAISRVDLARRIAAAEGKKVQVDIAQINEVLRLALVELAIRRPSRVLELLEKVLGEQVVDFSEPLKLKRRS